MHIRVRLTKTQFNNQYYAASLVNPGQAAEVTAPLAPGFCKYLKKKYKTRWAGQSPT